MFITARIISTFVSSIAVHIHDFHISTVIYSTSLLFRLLYSCRLNSDKLRKPRWVLKAQASWDLQLCLTTFTFENILILSREIPWSCLRVKGPLSQKHHLSEIRAYPGTQWFPYENWSRIASAVNQWKSNCN